MALRRFLSPVALQTWKNVTFTRISAPACSVYGSGITKVNSVPAVHRRFVSHEDLSREERLAAEAAKINPRDKPNIFQKIIDGEIKADTVYEDDQCMAFRDVNPVAPSHIIVIPRKPIPCLSESTDEDTPLLGHLLSVARKVAELEGLTKGFRIVMNNGRHGSQSVYHLHVHVIGGRQMRWPPG